MQIKQLVIGVASAGLLGLTPVALGVPTAATATTQADRTGAVATVVSYAAPESGQVGRKAKKKRKIKAKVNSKKFLYHGKVKPKKGAKKKKLILQRAKCDVRFQTCKFKKWKTIRTGKAAGFRTRCARPPRGKTWSTRAVMKGNKKFKRAVAERVCVLTVY